MAQLQLWAAGPLDRQGPALAHLPHVLLVLDCLPKALGGGERVALRLADRLPSAGFRVSLLTFAVHDGCAFSPQDAPCPIYLLPLQNTYGADALRSAFTYARFLRREDVKLVQTFFESSDLWAGLVTRLTSRARLVWSRRDMGILRQTKHAHAYRLLRRLPHRVFAVSAKVAEHAAEVDGAYPSKIRVIYNGLDLHTFNAVSQPHRLPGPVIITTIGNVREVKGHDLLIEAADRVLQAFPEVRFTVAGEVLEPEYYGRLQARIHELGLAGHFVFLGKVEDLSSHLRSAQIFVLPSRSEGFSNALIEAMAAGLPVVATDVGGNAEAIEDGQNGRIVPPGDVAQLADALCELLRRPERAQHLGEAARRTVEERFTVEAMVSQTAQAYREVLER